MIRIVICDDTQSEIEQIKHLLIDFESRYLTIIVKTYTDALALSQDIETIQTTDIFLLDIVMPTVSGVDLGKQIREQNKEASIIYITTSSDYALDAFGVSALQYLIKPITKESLFDALKKAITISNKKDRYFSIQTRTELIPVKINDIKYVEYKDHFLYFFLNDQTIKSKFFRSTFEEAIQTLFKEKNFILTHRAFLINMTHINKMNSNAFEMDNKALVPISKSRLNEVRRIYMHFLIRG
jgi:DNA-binding LytR/AlgR family response regulator